MKEQNKEIEYDIYINWNETEFKYFSNKNFDLNDEYEIQEKKSFIETLINFKNAINTIEYEYISEKKEAVVYFSDIKEFMDFKTKALILSKNNYIFEGDVMDMLRIDNEFNSKVAIKLNSFDINKTLPRILELYLN